MYPVFAGNTAALLIFETSSMIWFLPELLGSFRKGSSTQVKKYDRASRFILMAGIFGGIFIGILTAFIIPRDAIAWDRNLLFAMGIFLMLVGVAFRWYCVRTLGKYFTPMVQIQSGQTVVERGPYRLIRHPSYTGAMITMIGFGLTLTNWISLGMVVLGMAVGYAYRVKVEEQALLEGLGQPYRDYMKRTRRFIPFLF